MNIVMLTVAGMFFVAYLMKRRSRLRSED